MKQTFKSYLIEGETVNFADKAKWIAAMKEAGADEFLNEKEFNTTLIYAVGEKGTLLKGTWNPNKKTGFMYQGPKGVGMKFDKRRRKFTKAKL
jgi:hypothetical protein